MHTTIRLSLLAGMLALVLNLSPIRAEDPPGKSDSVAKAESTSTDAAKADAKTDTAKEKATKSKASVATFVLKHSYPERAGGGGLFGEIETNLRELSDRLEKARKDDKIAAVVLHFRNPDIGLGKVNELRAAIARTRSSGKKVYAELQIGMTSDYLLATACDEIIMPESGMLFVPGIRAEMTYFKRLFEKIGIKADFIQVGDYKGASEPFTRDAMSPEFRRQFESVIDDYYDQLISTIAESRKLDPKRVKQLVDEGVFSAERAKSAGLIDRITYPDQLRKELAGQLKADDVTWVKDYGKKDLEAEFSGIGGMMKMMEMMMGGGDKERPSRNKKIAVVYVSGAIMEGESEHGMFGVESAGSDTLVKALRDADDDPNCLGIVLRVDSPGGSGTASDIIWRQVVNSKKPVIASMGDTAASGGYYISMGAKKIYAEPGTLTGSIGVVSGKLAPRELLDKIGITTEAISRGQNSGVLHSPDAYTKSEREIVLKLMTEFYDQFTRKAAEGRKMDVTKMRDLAQGKLYSGRMAAAAGLVDAVGTLEDAIAESKKLAGLKPDDKIEILQLPKPKSFFESLFGGPSVSAEVTTQLKAVAPEIAGPLAEVQMLRKLFARPVVTILPFQVNIK